MKLIPSAELCGLTLICVCSDGGERERETEQLCMLMPSSHRYRPQRDRSGKNSGPGFEKESPETWTRKLSSSNKWVYRVHEMWWGGRKEVESVWAAWRGYWTTFYDVDDRRGLLANQCKVHVQTTNSFGITKRLHHVDTRVQWNLST